MEFLPPVPVSSPALLTTGRPSGSRRSRTPGRFAGAAALLSALFFPPLLPTICPADVGVGDAVPPLTVPLEGGAVYSLAEQLLERPVLLEFVSPQCKPCLDSRPALETLVLGLRTKDPVGLVSAALGAGQDLDLLPPANGALGEQRLLVGEEVAQAYGIFGTPVFLLIDREGTVVWKHVGRLTAAGVDRALSAALAPGRLAYVLGQGRASAAEPPPAAR